MTKPLNKPKNYIGNKGIPGVIHKIINLIPAHDYYLEPFAGGASIGKALPRCSVKHFNDLNKNALEQITDSSGATIIKTSVPAAQLLQSFGSGTASAFIFCDPPYLHETRFSDSIYNFEMTHTDHTDFLSAVQSLKYPCMIIHPLCELYHQALQSWNYVDIKIRYNSKTSTERIYMNYNKPQLLQTYRFIGTNCWERQAIKRKAERFLKLGPPLPFPEPTYITDIIQP